MAFQSLYRRYRSQTFAEVLGQEHITRALLSSVREGRVGHGYLFSGPRGTGKTSTARILAKALNCENPVDGEPDTTCANCVAVQDGRFVDWLQELDAASNGRVDAMRELLARVSTGTSGSRKVYILDEVHMLTAAASNALLKTLEEPPDHVIFVLATTEPHNVLPTIRSRTQHFEFNLLPAGILADHVRHVITDAGLELGEDAVEYVVRAGAGSARDTLSALDQVAAAGGVLSDETPHDDLIDALVRRDAAEALAAVDAAVRIGSDPQVIGKSVVDSLRHAFLVAVSAPVGGLTDAAVGRAEQVAAGLGRAGLTRSLEAIGAALIEMRQSPDPRIPLEVALVRLTSTPGDPGDIEALVARVERLEAALAAGAGTGTGPAAAPQTPPPPSDSAAPVPAPAPAVEPVSPPAESAPVSRDGHRRAEEARARLAEHQKDADPATPTPASAPARPSSRPSLGAVKRAREQQGAAAPADPAPTSTNPVPPDPAPSPSPADDAPSVSRAAVQTVWDAVLAEQKPRTRALYRAGDWAAGDSLTFALPNATHLDQCEMKREELQAALSQRLGAPVRLTLVVEGQAAGDAAGGHRVDDPADESPDDEQPEEETVDLDDLIDAPGADVGPVARLRQAFPGAELEEER